MDWYLVGHIKNNTNNTIFFLLISFICVLVFDISFFLRKIKMHMAKFKINQTKEDISFNVSRSHCILLKSLFYILFQKAKGGIFKFRKS